MNESLTVGGWKIFRSSSPADCRSVLSADDASTNFARGACNLETAVKLCRTL